MRFFTKLFGSEKLKIVDIDFGEVESFYFNKSRIHWKFNKIFLDSEIEILIEGNKNGIDENQKQLLLKALNNELTIKAESKKALKQQFENADVPFISIEKYFELKSISVSIGSGLEVTFQEKKRGNHFFNIHFENNKQIGVSIDG